mgnify:CR=1 FL=1
MSEIDGSLSFVVRLVCGLVEAVAWALVLYEYADTIASEEMAALVLIDIQVGFSYPRWGTRNNPHAEFCARSLLLGCCQIRGPIVTSGTAARLQTDHGRADPRPGFAIYGPLLSKVSSVYQKWFLA